MKKKCSKCNKRKLKIEFHKNKSHSDGLQSQCKPCHISSVMKHYKKDPDVFIEQAAKFHKRTRRWVRNYKATNKCKDCKKRYHFL